MLGAGSQVSYAPLNVRSFLLRIVALVSVLLSGLQTSCEKETGETDLQRGMKAYEAGNFAGASVWLSIHLRKHPKDAEAYDCRGRAREETGDLDGALADFDCALDLKPEFASGYVHRAIARKKRGDLDGAIADFGTLVELDPKNALAYYDRANLRNDRGDLDGAIADYTLAIQFDPKDAPSYFNRGIAFYLRRDWLRAREDFDAAARQEKPQEYGRLFSCVVGMRLGEIEPARGALRDNLKNRRGGNSGDWFSTLAGFLLGELDEPALLAAAKGGSMARARDQLCEACCFAGMARLSAGQRSEAADCFRRSIGTGRKNLAEYSLAEAELRALNAETAAPAAGEKLAETKTFRGKVFAVTAASIALRDKETGKAATFALSRETKVTLDGRRSAIDRVKPTMDATLILDLHGKPISVEATTKAESSKAAGKSGRKPAAR